MPLADVLDGTDSLVHLEAAHDAAWAATDPSLLRLCRDRMAMLLGVEGVKLRLSEVERRQLAQWSSGGFTDRETAALAYTEHYVLDVASMTDELVAPLRDHLGDEGLVDFANALLVVEQRMRLELIWDGVL